MKQAVAFLPVLIVAAFTTAQEVDTVNHTVKFNYQTGTIGIGDNLAALNLSDKFKYVNPKQASFILERLWGNPPGFTSLGMVFPANMEPTDSSCWGIVIEYTEEGYVKDKDADKINYDKLLKKMQKETISDNKERVKQGYTPVELVGWAEPPYYDKTAKKLYWGKEIKFGNAKEHTLNYNIRILGRKGYLVLNVVSRMDQLAAIKPYMKEIIGAVEFKQGNTYAEYNPKIDKTAAYGVAALVAGGVLAKAGFFKLLIAGIIALKKFIIIAAIGIVAFFRGGKKKKEQVLKVEEKVRKVEDGK